MNFYCSIDFRNGGQEFDDIHAQRVGGRLHVIDPEPIDETNPQRYVVATPSDVHVKKTTIAERLFSQHTLQIVPHDVRWQDIVPASGLERGVVAVAVDSAKDRIAIQAALPRKLINSWTQIGEAAVSRHGEFGIDGCLACLYWPSSKGRNEAEIIATELGLPERAKEIGGMLVMGTPLDDGFLRAVSTAKGIPLEVIAGFAGQPLQVFRARAVCGGLLLQAQGSAVATGVEVPAPFQSALAGVMLAAELVLQAAEHRREFQRGTTTTRLDLLRPIPSIITYPEAPREGCICGDPDYLGVYGDKFRIA